MSDRSGTIDGLSERHVFLRWLVPMIRARRGALWADERRQVFAVRWPRVGRKTDPHGAEWQFFRTWAVNNGHHDPGRHDEAEPRRWKDNMRSLLRKSDFIRPVDDDDPSRSMMENPQGYNFYQIVGVGVAGPKAADETDVAATDIPDDAEQEEFGEKLLDEILESINGVSGPDGDESWENLMDELTSTESASFASLASPQQSAADGSLQISPDSSQDVVNSPASPQSADDLPSPVSTPNQEQAVPTAPDSTTNDNMTIYIKYCGVIVPPSPARVETGAGCHLHYSAEDVLASSMAVLGADRTLELFGEPGAAAMVKLPDFHIPPGGRWGTDRVETERKGEERLEVFARGLRIQCDNGSVYVTRFCRGGVEYISQDTGGQATSLPRERDDAMENQPTKTKVFDIDAFNYLLAQYGPGYMPHPYIYLAVAQKFSENLRVQVMVAPERAVEALRAADPSAVRDPAHADFSDIPSQDITALISRTDQRDEDARLLREFNQLNI